MSLLSGRGWRPVLLTAAMLAAVSGAGAVSEPTLESIYAGYAAGDFAIVARDVRSPQDFRAMRLDSPKALDEWLGPWQPRKATFMIELAATANQIAPARTWPIVSAGRRYVTGRRARPGASAEPGTSAEEDEFERVFHRTAIALLERHGFVTYLEQYLEAIRARTSASPAVALADERHTLAWAIAQEQRCWNDRPDLDRAGAAADAVPRAAGQSVTSGAETSKSMQAKEREQRQACLAEAVTRFDAAAESVDAAEARVRGAWMRFQLGKYEDALRTIDGVDCGDDRELAHWAALFRGRILDALGKYADAERAYRAALAAAPNAQSAGVGLALALFKMDRVADADKAAVAVRTGPAVADPWWTYAAADSRFVERWIATLRRMSR